MSLEKLQQCNIFYSWETDLPNSTNRGFIQTALEEAAKRIRKDESIHIEPVLDRDTIGVPGAPDIADTIFGKIAKSHIFVADVSIININDHSRKTPNPNVLIELGFAINVLGFDRILMVMNTAFGNPEVLPFDLRMKRIISYKMEPQETDRSSERKKLTAILVEGVRTILDNLENEEIITPVKVSLVDEAILAITNDQPNQLYLVRGFMKSLFNFLTEIAPDFAGEKSEEEPDEVFMESIEKTNGFLFEFSKLSESIAVLNSQDSALALFKSLEQIVEKYNLPQGFSGGYKKTQFDFYKFIGHELFVTFISFLIIENRWELISRILNDILYVKNIKNGSPDSVSFERISEYIEVLGYRKNRLNSDRMSIHADILEERHTSGDLRLICPMEQFIAADFFLFLRAGFAWRPSSTLYLFKYQLRFLVEATNEKFAIQLLKPLNIETIDALRTLIKQRIQEIHHFYRSGFWDSHFEYYVDIDKIGSK
ncbi:MAG TPA: hypothetical protein VJZ78_00605 [Anaerolineales bacterium]|nr:hypothetical protein [Anaerolineales bacterium]